MVGPKPTSHTIRTTELIGPPQIRRLRQEHWEEIEEDASDRVWALFGSLAHAVLEKHAPLDALAEEGLNIELTTPSGRTWIVTGTPDLLDGDTLTDYKTTSAWTLVYHDGGRDEWERQLNVYAHLYRAHRFTVSRLQVVAILRDWSASQAAKSPDYPVAPIVTLDIPLWWPEACEAYITERLEAHSQATPAPCTDEERWAKPTTYAVVKAGRKTAIRVLEDRACADVLAVELGAGHTVEVRPGESVRCAGYCAVALFCPQRQAELEGRGA
jgi:hypothetical protein